MNKGTDRWGGDRSLVSTERPTENRRDLGREAESGLVWSELSLDLNGSRVVPVRQTGQGKGHSATRLLVLSVRPPRVIKDLSGYTRPSIRTTRLPDPGGPRDE